MLTTTIKSYLYQQYADDDDLQAFVRSYNEATQNYVDWFNAVILPYYPGLSGPLLDWAATGIYGMARISLESFVSSAQGPLNTVQLNQYGFPFNTLAEPSSTYFSLSDDIYQRMLTWNFYKGDGKRLTISWLKRRVMRFLLGVNGLDPQPFQPGFVVGCENTTPVSVTFASNTLTVSVSQAKLSAIASITPGVLQLFQLAFLSGVLELPAEYAYAMNITT